MESGQDDLKVKQLPITSMLQRLGTYISITSEIGYIKNEDLTFEGDSLTSGQKKKMSSQEERIKEM